MVLFIETDGNSRSEEKTYVNCATQRNGRGYTPHADTDQAVDSGMPFYVVLEQVRIGLAASNKSLLKIYDPR
jgi:hypothetical protein